MGLGLLRKRHSRWVPFRDCWVSTAAKPSPNYGGIVHIPAAEIDDEVNEHVRRNLRVAHPLMVAHAETEFQAFNDSYLRGGQGRKPTDLARDAVLVAGLVVFAILALLIL